MKDRKLPPIECWKDTLYGEDLPKEELDYCQQVWDLFGCKTLNDFGRVYLWCDVFHLADVLESLQ